MSEDNQAKPFEVHADASTVEVRLPIKMLSLAVGGLSTLGAMFGTGLAYKGDVERLESSYQMMAASLREHEKESIAEHLKCGDRIDELEYRLKQMEHLK